MTAEQGLYGLAALAAALLVGASAIAAWLSWRRSEGEERAALRNATIRIASAWVMVGALVTALLLGKFALLAVFACVSCVALSEFLTQSGIRWREHRTLISTCYALVPAQYALIGTGQLIPFLLTVPLSAFLILPALMAVVRDTKGILLTCGRAQWALMVSGYGLSHVTGIFLLRLPGSGAGAVLLVAYFIAVAQISDVMQYAFGKAIGRTPLSPAISPKKTVEGLVGGGLSAILLGTALWWITPFTPAQAIWLSSAIVVAGICGGLVLSAIKRDLGIKDWGRLIPGHGGVLDRADSLCFAAPIFFHLTWWTCGGQSG